MMVSATRIGKIILKQSTSKFYSFKEVSGKFRIHSDYINVLHKLNDGSMESSFIHMDDVERIVDVEKPVNMS